MDAPAPGHGMPVTPAVSVPEPESPGVHAILKTLGRNAVCPKITRGPGGVLHPIRGITALADALRSTIESRGGSGQPEVSHP